MTWSYFRSPTEQRMDGLRRRTGGFLQIILGVSSEMKSEEKRVGSTPHTVTGANKGLEGFPTNFLFVSGF